MRAAWYERTGPAGEVLVVGDRPAPRPGPGEVRVAVEAAGVNPADVKRRAGSGGRVMAEPVVIPGDDGAGIIDLVGPGVAGDRVGQRVWVHEANAGRPLGTSAEFVVVPADRAVPLPAGASFADGACLGVPAMTAHRAVTGAGSVQGTTVLVTGAAGAVGAYAVQMARLAGAARVLATVRAAGKAPVAAALGADTVLVGDGPSLVDDVLAVAPEGVDLIVDVAFGANLPWTAAVLGRHGTLAAYGSDAVPDPGVPFYPLMRRDVTVRFVSVFAMPQAARDRAVGDITAWLQDARLRHRVGCRYGLADVVQAHRAVEDGRHDGRVLIVPVARNP